jgi:hypothetical protein
MRACRLETPCIVVDLVHNGNYACHLNTLKFELVALSKPLSKKPLFPDRRQSQKENNQTDASETDHDQRCRDSGYCDRSEQGTAQTPAEPTEESVTKQG